MLGFSFVCYVLYISTSPSAENREQFEHVGRLCLPLLSLAYFLITCTVMHGFQNNLTQSHLKVRQ